MLRKFIRTIFFVEILQGMWLTLKSFYSRPVTRQYPEEKRKAYPGFRGLHALVIDPETGREKCIACGLCGAICPSQCITIHSKVDPQSGIKVLERYEIEVPRCVFCAFCVEACPVGAISLTEHFEYAKYTRGELYMTMDMLLQNWKDYMGREKGEEYFKKYWHPTKEDFNGYEDQPVWRGKEASKGIKNPATFWKDRKPEGGRG